MSFKSPYFLVLAAVVGLALLLCYRWLQGQRTRALARSGLTPANPRRARLRRHLPSMLMLAALVLLLVSAARPQATVPVPKQSGTVILAFDVSNSMAAKDV